MAAIKPVQPLLGKWKADRPCWPYSRAAELRQGRRGRLEPLVRRGGEDTGAGAEPGDR